MAEALSEDRSAMWNHPAGARPISFLRLATLCLLALVLASCDLFGGEDSGPDELKGRVVFSRLDTLKGKEVLYSVNLDGSDMKLLSFLTDSTLNPNGYPTPRGSAHNPRWSSDGQKIVYEEWQGPDESHIVAMRADGTEKRDLVPVGGFAGHPTWSKDGTQVLYDDGAFGAKFGIFVVGEEGLGPNGANGACVICATGNWYEGRDAPVYKGWRVGLDFSWATTSDLLYATGVQEPVEPNELVLPRQVFLLRISTLEVVKQLSTQPIPAVHFSISPDGRRVVYSDENDEYWLIALPDGTPELLLPNEGKAYWYRDVHWANDSRHIIYLKQSRAIDGDYDMQIYIMDVDSARTEVHVPTPFRGHFSSDLYISSNSTVN